MLALSVMDSSEYKLKKSYWNVKSRKTISDSMALIKNECPEVYLAFEKTLANPPIERPLGHTGGKESDFFEVQLSEDEVQDLIDILFEHEAAAVPQGDGAGFENEAIQAREASRIAGLVDEWNKLNVE